METTLTEDEVKLIELYRQLPPPMKQNCQVLFEQMLVGNLSLDSGKSFSITLGENAAVQIGNHNRQWHNVVKPNQ